MLLAEVLPAVSVTKLKCDENLERGANWETASVSIQKLRPSTTPFPRGRSAGRGCHRLVGFNQVELSNSPVDEHTHS